MIGPQHDLVIGDQPPSHIDHAQHEIGLPCPGSTEQQHGIPLPGDRTGMKQHRGRLQTGD
jgi:hypothetical protein